MRLRNILLKADGNLSLVICKIYKKLIDLEVEVENHELKNYQVNLDMILIIGIYIHKSCYSCKYFRSSLLLNDYICVKIILQHCLNVHVVLLREINMKNFTLISLHTNFTLISYAFHTNLHVKFTCCFFHVNFL